MKKIVHVVAEIEKLPSDPLGGKFIVQPALLSFASTNGCQKDYGLGRRGCECMQPLLYVAGMSNFNGLANIGEINHGSFFVGAIRARKKVGWVRGGLEILIAAQWL